MTTNAADLHPLMDFDVMLYESGFSADASYRKELEGRGLTKEQAIEQAQHDDYTGWAIHALQKLLGSITDKFNSRGVGYLTGSGNFREAEATLRPYKGTRDPTHKPKYYKELKQYMIDVLGARVIHGEEADDALTQTQHAHPDDSTVIVTIDKDLDQVPGWHYNWRKDSLYYVTPEEGDKWFWKQMLIGDASDNIPGINKIGPKTADKLITTADNAVNRKLVRELYDKQYGVNSEAAFLECANLLYMRREEGQQCPLVWE